MNCPECGCDDLSVWEEFDGEAKAVLYWLYL